MALLSAANFNFVKQNTLTQKSRFTIGFQRNESFSTVYTYIFSHIRSPTPQPATKTCMKLIIRAVKGLINVLIAKKLIP